MKYVLFNNEEPQKIQYELEMTQEEYDAFEKADYEEKLIMLRQKRTTWVQIDNASIGDCFNVSGLWDMQTHEAILSPQELEEMAIEASEPSSEWRPERPKEVNYGKG